MEVTLLILIIAAFLCMVALNVYFRIKVLRHFRVLRRNQVEFGSAHIFNKKKMEEEIIPRYPEMAEHLVGFSSNLRNTIRMASVLIFLITLFGAVLMYFRE